MLSASKKGNGIYQYFEDTWFTLGAGLSIAGNTIQALNPVPWGSKGFTRMSIYCKLTTTNATSIVSLGLFPYDWTAGSLQFNSTSPMDYIVPATTMTVNGVNEFLVTINSDGLGYYQFYGLSTSAAPVVGFPVGDWPMQGLAFNNTTATAFTINKLRVTCRG